jgi:NSS family neurotransmitter:Na+ symporter
MASRGGFTSRIGFIAAAAGSAVGLGNIWKFPFEVGQGGGAAFVVIYLGFAFLLCFPVMVTEIAIGRKTQKNPVGAFTALGYKNWRFVGIMGVLAGVLILSFYNVVAGWAFGYFLEMLKGHFEIGKTFGAFTSDVIKVGSYGLVFMLTTAFIVSRGISDGIEKASKILMPTLILMMLGLVLYSFSLPNAGKGIEFYLLPDFSKITIPVMYKALGQAFFSLSLGMGALITYGSYLSKKENIVTSAALITLTDVGIAFLAGLMMFPFVFSLGIETTGGAGLIFMALPEAFEQMGPVLGIIIGSLFFLLLSFAALTSTVSLLEVPVSYVVDEYKVKRKRAVWFMATIIFVVGIPSMLSNGGSEYFSNFITYIGAKKATDFMTFIGHVANDSFLPLGGTLIVIFAAYVWKKNNLHKEIEEGFTGFTGTLVSKYIDFAVTYLAPVTLSVIFIITVLDRFFGIHLF